MNSVKGAEVWVSFDHLSDAEFLKLVNETIEFIAVDTVLPPNLDQNSDPLEGDANRIGKTCMGFGDGSTLPVFETPLGKNRSRDLLGELFALLRATMYSKGIEIYCAPTSDARDTWLASMQHIAVEGRCFVLSCNHYCTRADYPQDYNSSFSDDSNEIVCRGGSCIVDPLVTS